nr:uncharacterized protein LOC104094661 [Nicotiana tomentosiformis]
MHSKKQRFKDKVSITKEVITKGDDQVPKTVPQWTLINFPLIQTTSYIKEKISSLTNKIQDLDILKEQEGNGHQNLEAEPPDSMEELFNVPVGQVQELDMVSGDKLNPEMFMEYIKEDIEKSLSDDEVIRGDIRKSYSEESLYLRNLATTNQETWEIIGDFNVITNREEKLGGRPYKLEESLDFIECLNEFGLQDAGFTGAKVTWCDNRDSPLTIWKRLDRTSLLKTPTNTDFRALDCIERCITDDDNSRISTIPTVQEVTDTVLSIDANSSPGPDGLSGIFYQKCWDVISEDVHNAVKAEIISDINKPNRGGNVVLKLDMTKAYDRISWIFLGKIIKNMGFSEQWIEIIPKCISNNWYSMLVNGRRNGFFQSERSLKQEDPLSHSLFILSAEILSQTMNNFHNRVGYKSFYMNINYPKVNHLSFADDTILFCNENKRSMRLILSTLTDYEKIFRKLINKNKSSFAMSTKTNLVTINRMKAITGMKYQKFPIKYLGCPLTTGRKKIKFYSDIVNKVIGIIRGWHTKLLSTEGRAILIRHVLLALPIHLLAAVNPPKGTLELIEKFVARFFWSGQDSGGKVRIGDSWSSIYIACEAHIQQTSSFPVKWIRPPAQLVKLNSDGNCSNGQCGGGDIIRDHEGKFIAAYSISLGACTSNYAEAEALLFGLK